MTRQYPVVRLQGKPFDLGLAHGRAMANEIRSNLELYERFINGLTGKDREQCLDLARQYQPVLEEQCPELMEEMQGIAQGAGVGLAEILLINARTEVATMDADPGALAAAECTAMGLAGERTASRRPILAQNWDWHERARHGTALFLLSPENGPRMAFVAEAGQVGKIGFNEHGVCVLLNILLAGQVKTGLPVHVMMRRILEQPDAKAAAALVKNGPNASANHLLVGDADGFIMGLEITSDHVAEIPLDDGLVLHTNHYLHPDLIPQDLGRVLFADSGLRYDRARAALSGRQQWDPDGLKELLRNHEDGPLSICRHVDESMPEFLHHATMASIIMEPARKRMHLACGQPCQVQYREITLT